MEQDFEPRISKFGAGGTLMAPNDPNTIYICYWPIHTGCGISLRTVGVASKPVQPRPLPFAGFFIYVKRKFVANLKVISLLMWK